MSSAKASKKRKTTTTTTTTTQAAHGVLSQFDLSGRQALVTGGYGTLGLHMCRALLEAGATVIIMGRNEIKCKEAVERFKSEDLDLCSYLISDVTERSELERCCELFEEGGLDILVNAAGGNTSGATVMPTESFFKMDDLAFRQNLDLNFSYYIIIPRLVSEVPTKSWLIKTFGYLLIVQSLTFLLVFSK